MKQDNKECLSLDSSIGSISARYLGGLGFKSQQGREFFNENKKLIYSNLNKIIFTEK